MYFKKRWSGLPLGQGRNSKAQDWDGRHRAEKISRKPAFSFRRRLLSALVCPALLDVFHEPHVTWSGGRWQSDRDLPSVAISPGSLTMSWLLSVPRRASCFSFEPLLVGLPFSLCLTGQGYLEELLSSLFVGRS